LRISLQDILNARFCCASAEAMDKDKVRREFRAAVNMTAAERQHWLETDQSHRVGFRRAGDIESVGHASGRHILRVLRKDAIDLTDQDYAHHAQGRWLCAPAQGAAAGKHLYVALALQPDELGT
jgi:Flp pilus assembly protein TadD